MAVDLLDLLPGSLDDRFRRPGTDGRDPALRIKAATAALETSRRPGGLLTVLEVLQQLTRENYLSTETLEQVADRMGIARSQIISVATFYSLFNLDPQGEFTISVCRGTACHTRGSKALLQSLKDLLGVATAAPDQADKDSLTTADGRFTIRTVACFGQCAMAPVVEGGPTIYGHMTRQQLPAVIEEIQQERRT